MKGKPPFVCRVSVERFANRDNGPAVNAQLVLPSAIALDNLGNLYVTDNNDYVIRKIDVTGKITTVVPPGQLYNTYGLTADSAGNLYIADTEHCRVMKLAGSTLTQFAGIGTPGNSNCGDNGDGGTATAAQLDHPYGLIFDKAGNLYIAESGGNIIRKIDTSGNISTLVGTGGAGSGGDGGPLLAAQLNGPQGVALDAAGNLYIAEAGSNYVRKVGTTAAVSFPAVRVSPIAGRTQQVLLQINRTLTISSVAVQPAIRGVAEYTVGTLQGCTADGMTQQSAKQPAQSLSRSLQSTPAFVPLRYR
jgi:streptogramin lyase